MVKDLHEAMQAALGTLGLPVYAEGRVPDGACYPYLVWSCRPGASDQETQAVAACWFRGDHAACVAMLDTLCRSFPECGRLLRWQGSAALLWCREAYVRTDSADTSVTGGVVKLGLRCYSDETDEEARS